MLCIFQCNTIYPVPIPPVTMSSSDFSPFSVIMFFFSSLMHYNILFFFALLLFLFIYFFFLFWNFDAVRVLMIWRKGWRPLEILRPVAIEVNSALSDLVTRNTASIVKVVQTRFPYAWLLLLNHGVCVKNFWPCKVVSPNDSRWWYSFYCFFPKQNNT